VAAIIFPDRVQKYPADLAAGKRRLVWPTTLNAIRTNIKQVLPLIGEMSLENITNGTPKNLTNQLVSQGWTLPASAIHHQCRVTIAPTRIPHPSNVPAQCITRVAASLCART
jgi:hypothetical protein